VPLGRKTRAHSANRRAGSGTCSATCVQSTVSKLSSANGMSSALPKTSARVWPEALSTKSIPIQLVVRPPSSAS
jgi:hypothetical protein